MSILRWWVSVSETDRTIMPWGRGCKSDSGGCNEVRKRTAKYPLKSKGYQAGTVRLQVVSVSILPHESLLLPQLWIFPARTNCLMTIVSPISESCFILHIPCLQCCYWMLHGYVVYGPVFAVNMLEKQFLTQKDQAHCLSQLSWTLHREKKWHRPWPKGLELQLDF